MRPLATKPPSWAKQAWLIADKDFAIELATKEIVVTSGFFAVLVGCMASSAFALEGEGAVAVAPGVIWIALAFSAVLAISRAWQREREDNAILGILVLPVARSAIFAGKALTLAVFIAIVELLIVPLAALFFHFDLARVACGLLLLSAAAIPGVAASGTLFGAMTVRTRARDLVLASVLFPLMAPILLAAVAGTRELFGGASVGELADYVMLMGVFDFVFWAGGLGLFESLMEG